jgi:hypothetical protein
MHNRTMADGRDEPSDYHVVARLAGESSDAWIWEIFHRGEPLPVRIHDGDFQSHDAAIVAGRLVLNEYLERLLK